jgi:SAM-dependent methyltransferase
MPGAPPPAWETRISTNSSTSLYNFTLFSDTHSDIMVVRSKANIVTMKRCIVLPQCRLAAASTGRISIRFARSWISCFLWLSWSVVHLSVYTPIMPLVHGWTRTTTDKVVFLTKNRISDPRNSRHNNWSPPFTVFRQQKQCWSRHRIMTAAATNQQHKNQPEEMSSLTPASIYSLPALYDLAFGYRSFDEEVDFLLAKHTEIVGSMPRRILEVAAGPARHSITALLLQCSSTDIDENIVPTTIYCIDSSPEMAAYAQQLLQDEIANLPTDVSSSVLENHFHYQVADMRNFTLHHSSNSPNPTGTLVLPTEQLVDTVWILLGSLQHMITNQDVIDCFRSIYNVLSANGTVFIELPHPRESTFNMMECTRNGWKVPLQEQRGSQYLVDSDDEENDSIDTVNEVTDESELSVVWGDDGDTFDPITQVRHFSIRFDLSGLDEAVSEPVRDNETGSKNSLASGFQHIRSTHQVVPMRLFTAQEIDALARCAGFNVVAMYGALEDGVSVDDEDTSYRLVSVLRKELER